MSDKLISRLVSGCFLFAFTINVSMADDIGIYIQDVGTHIQPNVLFILDNSGSMNNSDVGTGVSGVDGREIKETRVSAMKRAAGDALNLVNDANVGLMQFSRYGHRSDPKFEQENSAGSTVVFPITDIGAAANTIPGERASSVDVRKRIRDIIDNMKIGGFTKTPIVQSLYEAARYWRGEEVEFGGTFPFSHPGSYCTTDAGTLDCPGLELKQDPDNPYLDYYGVILKNASNSNRCPYLEEPPVPLAPLSTLYGTLSEQDMNKVHQFCRTSLLNVRPGEELQYKSPIIHECQKNYQVLLSDGRADSVFCKDDHFCPPALGQLKLENNCKTKDSYQEIENGSIVEVDVDIDVRKYCGPEIVEFMYTEDQAEDQSTGYDGLQRVETSTIGFALKGSIGEDAAKYLKLLANTGGGKFYEAENAAELKETFKSFLGGVSAEVGAAAAPSIPKDLSSGNSVVYLTPFTPSAERSWKGNIKKYYFCSDPTDNPVSSGTCTWGDLLDSDGNSVVEEDNAGERRFKKKARSLWANVEDGDTVTLGGVGSRIQVAGYKTQLVYTDSSNGDLLKFDHDDWNIQSIRDEVCPSQETREQCEDRMLWILGRTPGTEDTRWAVSDSIHSSPVVITYGDKGDKKTFYDRVVVGSNDGSLRFINADSGNQEWKFYPQSMLAGLQEHYGLVNLMSSGQGKLYGIDLTPVIRTIDHDDDGSIEPGNKDAVHVIFGMRRGGRWLYSIDVSPDETFNNNTAEITPDLNWRIEGGKNPFKQLGQTWSSPVLATIQVVNNKGKLEEKEVLIFGGGYDEAIDDRFDAKNITGNAVYIVDPDEGDLILSFSSRACGGNKKCISVSDMKYPVPSAITTLDSQNDGRVDRLYFSDTGGQVWRIDLGHDIQSTGGLATNDSITKRTVIGRLANISAGNDKRKFFKAPALARVDDTEYAKHASYYYVLIGSGDRANPLETTVNDRFYAFRDYQVSPMLDANEDHFADQYPKRSGGKPSPITDDDMIDITTTSLAGKLSSAKGNDDAINKIKDARGWYYDFNEAGQKVLSKARVYRTTVLFSGYIPSDKGHTPPPDCRSEIGKSKIYGLDIISVGTARYKDKDGTIKHFDRDGEPGGAGILSDLTPTGDGGFLVSPGSGGPSESFQLVGGGRVRTYWYQEF